MRTRELSWVILFWCFGRYNFNTTTSSKARSEWKVIHWRSGSRPWTLRSCPWTWCKSYHGSFSQNSYPLVISSSCIRGSIIYDRGLRPCSPLNTISRASLSTCLLQSNTPVQPLLWFVDEYSPLVSRNYHGTAELLMSSSSSTTFSRIPIFHGLCVIRHSKDTDNWLESASRLNNSW